MSGHVYCYHYTTCAKPGKWSSCVLLTSHYLYKTREMSGLVYCYDYTTCKMPGKWAVMRILTITPPVQSLDNDRSCVLLPLHYLYKARTMRNHVYCYHYTTCTKPGQWAVMCIITITLPIQNQAKERSCVLLPLHYLYKARTISGLVYGYHYTICAKPGQWTVICIVTSTLPVQSQDNERSYVLIPLQYLYKA
jgi:hypothetical protein